MTDYLAIAGEALKRYYALQAQGELSTEPPALPCSDSNTEMVIPAVRVQKDPNPASEPSTLKGQAVELWRDGKRFFVVTDDADAQEAIRRFGARRGEIWTSGELELVARFEDQAARDAVEALKWELDNSLSQDDSKRGISQEEWRAAALNRLFDEQGNMGPGRTPANIQPETIEHGSGRPEAKR